MKKQTFLTVVIGLIIIILLSVGLVFRSQIRSVLLDRGTSVTYSARFQLGTTSDSVATQELISKLVDVTGIEDCEIDAETQLLTLTYDPEKIMKVEVTNKIKELNNLAIPIKSKNTLKIMDCQFYYNEK